MIKKVIINNKTFKIKINKFNKKQEKMKILFIIIKINKIQIQKKIIDNKTSRNNNKLLSNVQTRTHKIHNSNN